MDATHCNTLAEIAESSDFALLTSKVSLLRNILQIVQTDEKTSNTIEFTKDVIHICSNDSMVVQMIDLDPTKMGRYHPPVGSCACTFHCSKLVKFFKPYTSDIVVSIAKPKGLNELQIKVFKNNIFTSHIVITLESEDNVSYINDAPWDSVPHMMVNVLKFCCAMRYSLGYSSSNITCYPKHLVLTSYDKVKASSTSRCYGETPPEVIIQNSEISKSWESLVERHLNKTDTINDDTKSQTLVILNHLITYVNTNAKLISILSKMKNLTKSDPQMISCYYQKDLPLKFDLEIMDHGNKVGTYKIYILGIGYQQIDVGKEIIQDHDSVAY